MSAHECTLRTIEDLREAPVLRSLSATIRSFAVDIVAAGLVAVTALWVATPRTRRGRLAAAAD